MKSSKGRFGVAAFFAGIFAYCFAVGLLIPLFADDYSFSFVYETDRRIESASDVLESQIIHYLTWGGRAVAHTLGQLFLLWGKPVFAFANSLLFVALLMLIYRYASVRRRAISEDAYGLFLIFFFAWVCLPSFGETVFWLIGSVNYLWTTVLVLLFLLPYRRLALEGTEGSARSTARRISKAILMFPFGVAAGWTNENTAMVMIGLAALASFVAYRRSVRPPLHLVSGIAGAAVGYAFLLLAPGNRERAKVWESFDNYSFVNNHIVMPIKTLGQLAVLQAPLWIVLGATLLAFAALAKREGMSFFALLRGYKDEAGYPLVMIAAGMAANLAMFAAPTFPLRAGFASSVFLIVGTIGLVNVGPVRDKVFLMKHKRAAGAFFAVCLLASMTHVMFKYETLHRENAERLALIERSRAAGETSIEVPPFSVEFTNVLQSHVLHVFVHDIGTDPNAWPNTHYATYFELDAIRVADEQASTP